MLRYRLFAVLTVILADYYWCLDSTWMLVRRTACLPPAKERIICQWNSGINVKEISNQRIPERLIAGQRQ